MQWINDTPPYKIYTDRLVLKCWEPQYASQLLEVIKDSSESLLPWMPFSKPPFPTLEQEIVTLRKFRGDFDLNNNFVFGVFDKSEKVIIGSTGLHPGQGPGIIEIGYWISKKHQNNGYATEIASSLIKAAFEYSNIDQIEINCASDNEKSKKVINKLGLKNEGILRNNLKDANGIFHDLSINSILRDEYYSSKHKSIDIQVVSILGTPYHNT